MHILKYIIGINIDNGPKFQDTSWQPTVLYLSSLEFDKLTERRMPML